MVEQRIMMRNPNTGREDRTIALTMYEPVRGAILSALAEAGTAGLAFSQLADEVERLTPASLWADASVMWYTTTVKLHLEATEAIVRFESPQRLRLVS